MSLSIGIVGLPNVGKSTLFYALTKKQVSISNYPFCTIDPNVGVVRVPDKRLDKLAQILIPNKVLPTTIEFVDIAGLVKGAHKGEGLGNQFLAQIREVDAIILILRSFGDANVAHVAGKVDPENDKETIHLELIMADLGVVKKRLTKVEKEAKSGDQETLKIKEVLKKIKTGLEQARPASRLRLSDEERLLISGINLLTMKPVLYVFNIDEISAKNIKLLKNDHYITVNVMTEKEVSELTGKELSELGLKPKLDELIAASYHLLDIITFFTVQNKILQAWIVKRNTKAPQAADKIHTDMKKGFIKVEVIAWDKLVELGSEQAAREKGLIRAEGKDYMIQDGDVCRFLFNR
jgi:GTP-binding protein YchF